MTININDKLWTQPKKEEVIKSSANAYERAKWRIPSCDDPPPKVPCVSTDMLTDASSESVESEDETTSSDCELSDWSEVQQQ